MRYKFEEVKADYEKLMDDYGTPEDMTGAFVDAERMEKVIRNPTKKNAMEYMIQVIQYGFQGGCRCWKTEFNGQIPIDGDEFLEDCYIIYGCD